MARVLIDSWLLDRGFQPIADRLETCEISIFNVARFFSDGASFAFMTQFLSWVWLDDWLMRDSSPIVIAMIFGLGCACGFATFANRRVIRNAERLTKPGTMNPARFACHPLRVMCVVFLLWDTEKTIFDFSFDHMLNALGWASWMLAAYFVSCSRRPMMRQTNKIPAGHTSPMFEVI